MIYGIGVNDVDEPTADLVDGKYKVRTEYNLWKNMIKRVSKGGNTYSDCMVCEEWKLFSRFRSWYFENYREGLALDKDLLIAGNKEYSPVACAFVPKELNNLFLIAAKSRGLYPIGVWKDSRSDSYQSEIVCMGERVRLGSYKTPQEAHRAWQSAKITSILRRLDWYEAQESFNIQVYYACCERVAVLNTHLGIGLETTFL